jgi:hypothetical protein
MRKVLRREELPSRDPEAPLAKTARVDVVKVFSATKARDREVPGDRMTAWLRARPGTRVVKRCVLQSSDSEYHCLSIVVFARQDLAVAE